MSNNDTFLRACRREAVEYTPVWLMRQAGRYMKEYRSIRRKHSFLEMCKTPDIAAEVTLQPINKIGVDAAIIFADILLPLEGMGIGLKFAKDEGPVISKPVRTRADIDNIRIIEPEEDVPYLIEAIKIVKKELNGKVPLIGFSGAPFTLASYIIEGGHSRNYQHTKKLMYREPLSWHLLMGKIADVVIRYLNAQIGAGVQAVQVFDSWVGCLGPRDYKEFVLPHTKKVIQGTKQGIPVINFATNSATLLELIREAGGDVIGVDWRINLADAWKRIGYDRGIQGNLDPVALFAPREVIRRMVKDILDEAENRSGHIFNLGHGILPQTPVENVIALIDAVHEFSRRK